MIENVLNGVMNLIKNNPDVVEKVAHIALHGYKNMKESKEIKSKK